MNKFNVDEWQAYGEWVILKPVPMTSTTKSGLVLPRAMNLENKALRRCEVISIGSKVEEIKVGDMVWAMVLMGQWLSKDDGNGIVMMKGTNNIFAKEGAVEYENIPPAS